MRRGVIRRLKLRWVWLCIAAILFAAISMGLTLADFREGNTRSLCRGLRSIARAACWRSGGGVRAQTSPPASPQMSRLPAPSSTTIAPEPARQKTAPARQLEQLLLPAAVRSAQDEWVRFLALSDEQGPEQQYYGRLRLRHDSARGRSRSQHEDGAAPRLPSFVIGGAQKSGTTYLFDYFLSQPRILPPRLAELHYFTKFYTRGLGWYESAFLPAQQHQRLRAVRRDVSFESTPSLLPAAASGACMRLRETLPHAKLLLLLRDPVQRALSEHAMKVRRVRTQRAFLDAVQRNAAALRACMRANNPYAQQPYRRRFVLRGLYSCLPGSLRAPAFRSQLLEFGTAFMRPRLEHASFEGCFDEAEERGSGHADVAGMGAGAGPQLGSARDGRGGPRVVRLAERSCVTAPPAGSGYAPVLYESVQPFQALALQEVAAIERCVGGSVAALQIPLRLLMARLRRCFGDVNHNDISRHYLLRSLYAPQLAECFASVPREQVLVIDSAEMRARPGPTLCSAARFVGLGKDACPRQTYFNRESSEQRAALRSTLYPSFASESGWLLDSRAQRGDPSLSPAARARLERFFAPYNHRLRQLLRMRFSSWPLAKT